MLCNLNPKASVAFKTFDLPGVGSDVDQCRFNLRLHKQVRTPGLRVRKSTRLPCVHGNLQSSGSARLAESLHAKSNCPSHRPKHDIIEGNDRINGKWIRRSAYCSSYATEFATHIIKACERALGFDKAPNEYQYSDIDKQVEQYKSDLQS